MFNEYVLIDSIYPGQRVRESEQREDSVRPAEGAAAAGRGRMEGSRRERAPGQERPAADHRDRLRRPGLGALLHDLPGGPAQGRHHAESAARDVRNAGQAARRAHIRHGVDRVHGRSLFPEPGSRRGCRKLADEKNTNNITGFKNQRADEIIGPTPRHSTSTSA